MQTSCEKAPVDKVDAAKSTTLLQSITNLAALPVEIYCDDSWLDTTDVAGDVNTDNGIFYYDGRPGSTRGWINFTNLNGICRDNPQRGGFTIDIATESVVTLCQSLVPGWIASFTQGSTLTNLLAGGMGPPPAGLIKLASNVFVSMLLLHEFTHARQILPDNSDNSLNILGKST
ncbi:hypothetical protein ACEPPN_007517 [Leptodophora sp. 'Broadleaf-Isolate-01']